MAAADRGLLAELCYGSLRFYYELDAITQLLLLKPLRDKDADVHALLMVGLYQLRHMRTAEHAAVDTTVTACKALDKPWAEKLINGLLRNYLRERSDVDEKIAHRQMARYNHPQWLIAAIKAAWPHQLEEICTANNQQGGMSVRVNTRQCAVADYAQQLAALDIASTPSAIADQALLLAHSVAVDKLPGFSAGLCSVQDVAAQLCAPLLRLASGQRVLDACCAPGGKTGHILQMQADLSELVAIDCEEKRLVRVRENMARLQVGISATTPLKMLCADAADTDSWHDGKHFDRILLDAPCSGTGVIRRHPDIKHLRRATDIAALAEKQAYILAALWPLLAPGGILLYATCSILPQENEQTVSKFLAKTADARLEKITATWGIETACGRQLLPAADHDGFYFARIIKAG